MDVLLNIGHGRTAVVYRVGEGLVCKSPWSPESKRLGAEIENAFAVEKKLLERLGVHPRIIQYHKPHTMRGMKEGLLLSEANCGNLQSYLDREDNHIDNALRRKWSLQIAEAVAYVHKKGIIHSNLSTTNVLVHQAGQTKTPNLILAEFGGSKCPDLGLNGHLLPDDPFFDPHLEDFESPKVDVFGLGVLLYIINTGQYPFYEGRLAPQNEERFKYENHVHTLFEKGEFPSLSGVQFGDVIAGCCCQRRFETAEDVVVALKAEMRRDTSR